MYEQSRPRRNPLRYLAPLALAAIVLATYLVVQHNVSSSSAGSNVPSATSTGHGTSTSGAAATKKISKSKYYRVRSGDSLSVISARTGVPLPTLESLNPGVSSSNLQVGQRLKLRR